MQTVLLVVLCKSHKCVVFRWRKIEIRQRMEKMIYEETSALHNSNNGNLNKVDIHSSDRILGL